MQPLDILLTPDRLTSREARPMEQKTLDPVGSRTALPSPTSHSLWQSFSRACCIWHGSGIMVPRL